MIINQKDPNSLALEFDIEGTMKLQKEALCTSPDRVYGFMWYLIRNYFGINQTEMGNSFQSPYKAKYKDGLSKSAYSKIENGTTSINFDLILIYSGRYGLEFQKITEFYNYLLHIIYHKDAIYLDPCGYLGFGKDNGYANYTEASKDSLYTDLKDYKNFFSNNELAELNEGLNMFFAKAKEAILYKIVFDRERSGRAQ